MTHDSTQEAVGNVRSNQHPRTQVLRQLLLLARVSRKNCEPAIAAEAAMIEQDFENQIERLEAVGT